MSLLCVWPQLDAVTSRVARSPWLLEMGTCETLRGRDTSCRELS